VDATRKCRCTYAVVSISCSRKSRGVSGAEHDGLHHAAGPGPPPLARFRNPPKNPSSSSSSPPRTTI